MMVTMMMMMASVINERKLGLGDQNDFTRVDDITDDSEDSSDDFEVDNDFASVVSELDDVTTDINDGVDDVSSGSCGSADGINGRNADKGDDREIDSNVNGRKVKNELPHKNC